MLTTAARAPRAEAEHSVDRGRGRALAAASTRRRSVTTPPCRRPGSGHEPHGGASRLGSAESGNPRRACEMAPSAAKQRSANLAPRLHFLVERTKAPNPGVATGRRLASRPCDRVRGGAGVGPGARTGVRLVRRYKVGEHLDAPATRLREEPDSRSFVHSPAE